MANTYLIWFDKTIYAIGREMSRERGVLRGDQTLHAAAYLRTIDNMTCKSQLKQYKQHKEPYPI